MKYNIKNTYKFASFVATLFIYSYSFAQGTDSTFQKLVLKKMQLVDSLCNYSEINFFPPISTKGVKVTGSEQDCPGAIPVCQQTYTQPNSYTGYGTIQEVYSTCLLAQERQSVWYVFTIQSGGTFGFNLATLNDYDFALYNITTSGCAGVPGSSPIRCNFSADYGPTGMSGAGVNPSEPASGSPWSTMLNVVVGQTYALIIDNYTQDNNGYTLTFTGTASIFDNVAPTINPPNTVVNNCNNTITITFSEPIKCSSIATVAPFDFTITGTTITSVSGVGCSSNGLTNQVVLTISAATPTGTYTIGVQNGSDGNTLLDKCGTPMLTSQTVSVTILGAISASATPSTICSGANSSLSVTNIAGASYSWSPSAGLSNPLIYNPTANTPSSTTTYTVSVTYAGCTKTANTTITVENKPIASINPMNPIICSGTTNLTASATVNGSNCTTCTYAWSNGPTSALNSGLGAGTYTVTVTSSASCVSIPVSSTISLASAPPATTCNIIYASVAGGGDGLTPTTPTTLATALTMAMCNNSIIKMATGTYNINNKIVLTDYVTLEGGYQSNYTQKTSVAGSTIINRTVSNVEGYPDAPRLVAIEAISATGFRLQDLTITTANAPASNGTYPKGVSTYGIYLNTCSNYNIVRCQIQPGNASSGLAGSSGTAGSAGGNGSSGIAGHWDNDYSSNGGAGGSSPCGCPGGAGGHNAWSGGSSTAGTTGSCTGGAGGPRGVTNRCDWLGCSDPDDGGAGSSGAAGSAGAAGAAGSAGSIISGFWSPGGIGSSGGTGTDGRGGGGGGGGALEDGSCDNGCGSSGSGGGGGGCKGTGGTGGYGGGAAYGVFLNSNGASGNIIDCYIPAPTAGSGGAGGAGGTGGSGGTGGPWIDPDCDVGAGGAGGNGGSGGSGGNGGNGSTGEASAVRTYSGSALVANSALTLSTQPTIVSGDATNNDKNCTNVNINLTTAVGSPTWSNLGANAAPASGSGSPITVQYTATGRKNISLQSTSSSTYTWTDNFEASSGWSFSGATIGAVSNPCGSACSSPVPRSGSNVLNLPQCSAGLTTYASVTLTLASPGTFSGYYQLGAEVSYDYFTWNIDALPNRTTNQVSSGACISSWTFFSFAVPAGTHTIYLGFSTDGSNQYNGSRTVIDDVQCTNVSTTTTTTNTYTGFENILINAPSPGTITQSATGICPGETAAFTSSLAGSLGYTYLWTTPGLPGGVTSSIATPTASSTNITFTNSNATAQTATVQLVVTSKCCGTLAPVTTTITVYPSPGALTATVSNPTPCPGSSVTFTATAPAGSSFTWWNAASGGAQIGSGGTYTLNPVGAAGTVHTVYLQAENSNGCISTTRLAVSVTSTATAAPTLAAAPTTCGQGDVTMQVTSPLGAQYSYVWYSGSCGGTVLQSSTSPYFTTNISANTTFYVAVINGTCNAGNCASITATITNSQPTSATWTGAIDRDWFRTGNWTLIGGTCLPGCNTNVTIPNVVNDPIIDASALNPANNPASTANITIQTGGLLSIYKNDLEVCGNFDHSGTVDQTGGNVIFIGTSPQTYRKPSTGSGIFLSIIMNNSTGLTLLEGISYQNLATQQLTFNIGKITTEGNKEVEITNSLSGSIGGHGINGYIIGHLKRSVIAAGIYDYPLGNTNGYELMRIEVTSVSGGLTHITGWFVNPSAQTTTGLPLAELGGQYQVPVLNCGGANATTDHANDGIWVVLPTPSASSAVYNMSLYGRNFTPIGASAFTIIKRNTFECVSNVWSLNGVYHGSSNVGNVAYARRTAMSGFSKFAIAPHTLPLPIELMFFNAFCEADKNQIKISWATLSEINNSHFTVEYSTDGLNFVELVTIPGADNSTSVLQYSYIHNGVECNECFYRLKQTDYNGEYTYIDPIQVNCSKKYEFELMGFVPNPAKDDLFAFFTDNKDETVYIGVFDITGRKIISTEFEAHNGQNKSVIDLSQLPAGVYYVKLTNSEKTLSDKIVKQY